MTERPSERDLALDAIDEAFKTACGGMYRDLQTYAPGTGVGPKTFDEAKVLARGIFNDARAKRAAAIAIVNQESKG